MHQIISEFTRRYECISNYGIYHKTGEMFQNAGEKRDRHLDVSDLPRRRGNKRRGHGTYANDRPPLVGTKGCESGS